MHNKSVAQLVKGLRERQFSSVEVTRTTWTGSPLCR
jgi:hypothetical protein